MKASALSVHVQSLNLPFKTLTVVLQNEKVTLKGEVDNQSDAEKIALAVVNVEGVSPVDNQIEVVVKQSESKYLTVVEGD
ncbi:BON domain-containing protein [Flavobacterium xueshanense]|uniref:BON domain-containing protein n=1 Tax=Flavobacterium xueshanense TaxID=935223 RepID=A0A1I2CVM2_9FLAO|nr:BON domain-containing protein [Flavobacterium xueshanense]SFE72235.1 BON domain-containing protein [Flavobacterium xueshanense]